MLSHLNKENQPTMVNVGKKAITRRMARAQAIVQLSPEITAEFDGAELQSKKGPVFQTAILAGICAAKKTSDLIPLCHPLPLDDCQVSLKLDSKTHQVTIEAVASVEAKTGIEMEALTAVSVAALTLYDMCKALSHRIQILNIRLLEKTGGKKDYLAD
ncbi:MAG: cyclic pyranopterin monophosphate synthase MoaC [Opitutaceae bacterium]|nr:cyclic pyranopterin monophosphate synthase MoaC [Opitutaceae bacterium]